jgi:4-aminobutyrate aminotransferase-like enzyme
LVQRRKRDECGHCNPDILAPAIEQLRCLQHTTTIYLTERMLELARVIAELAPPPLRRSFFCASGSEANEGAMLLATLATGRRDCAYLREGLHGRTKWAMSVTGLDLWRTDPDPLVTAHSVPGPCHPDSLALLERLLRSRKSQPSSPSQSRATEASSFPLTTIGRSCAGCATSTERC